MALCRTVEGAPSHDRVKRDRRTDFRQLSRAEPPPTGGTLNCGFPVGGAPSSDGVALGSADGLRRAQSSRAAPYIYYFFRTSFVPQHMSFAGVPFSQPVPFTSMWSSSTKVSVASCMCLSLFGSRLPPPAN